MEWTNGCRRDLCADCRSRARGVVMGVARLKRVAGAVAAGALLFSSTGAIAASTPAPQQLSPWAALTMLSGGAPAAAVCGAAAAAAAGQAAPTGCVLPVVDAPPPVAVAEPAPVPPVAPVVGGPALSPLLLGLVAIAVGVGLFFAVKGNGNNKPPVVPVSAS